MALLASRGYVPARRLLGPAHRCRTVITGSEAGSASVLESGRYGRDSILRSEFVYGHGFQCPAGLQTTRRLSEPLQIRAGNTVLDMGCGTGGASFYLAEHYKAEVVGVDIEPENIAICQERNTPTSQCSFRMGSMLDAQLFSEHTFDFIWSRDVLVYLETSLKEAALKNFLSWLRPGGSLMITDYARGASITPALEAYLSTSKLKMDTMETYENLLSGAGFVVRSADVMADFGPNYERDLASFLAQRAAFEERFGEEQFEALRRRWELKCSAIREGGLVGLHLVAQRPK
eukprot:TRINITY_DN73298_c0_g2_i1.p2 TRINITY_DN73298_c0_g2~~TRINITY_DN73298_c0_g2_i1.p2  ORF type:complete len:289 (-),score=51.57 TRINITY_DN73298_c0_g2_i1:422-1288(-)